MARPKKVRLTPPEKDYSPGVAPSYVIEGINTEKELRRALIEQSIDQAKAVVWDKVELQPEVTVMPAEAKKQHKTWNHHMHADAKGFYQAMKGKWDKLTDADLLMVNTEGNLVGAVAKRYEMPEEMAQVTVSEWMKSL